MASYLLCCFLLHLLFGAVLAGTEKFAYSGMSFKLFTNLTFQNHMSLYRNGNEKSVIIGIWEVKNAAFTSTYLNRTYTGKIFMEVDKTPFILICNVDQTLAAKYVVIYDKDTQGPEVELKIIGDLTEDEFHKLLDDDLGFMKKYFGNFTGEQIGQIRKLQDENTEHIKEYLGNLTEVQIGQIRKLQDDNTEHIKEYLEKVISEQILKMLPSNHPKEVLKESSDKVNPLVLGLLIVLCIIGMLILIGIIILLCIQANNKDRNDCQADSPTLDQLPVQLYVNKNESNQAQMSEQNTCIAPQTSDKDRNDCQADSPTLDQLPVQVYGNKIESNQAQMSEQNTCIAPQTSDMREKHDKAKQLIPSLSKGIEPYEGFGSGTGNEDNQDQLQLASKYNSPSSDEPILVKMMSKQMTLDASRNSATFSVPSLSGTQLFNKDKQGINPEQDTAQDVRVDIEDSDSDDKCQEPLLNDEARM